jgi:hypothetical protein
MLLATLAACGSEQPVAPAGELELAASLSVEASNAMGGPTAGPASIIRRLAQQVREGDNAEAKALLAEGKAIQAIALQFPNAAARIGGVVRQGLDRARAALGDREAPRIRKALDDIGTLLRQAAAADAAGRKAGALDAVIRASNMLDRLVDHVRGGTPTGR